MKWGDLVERTKVDSSYLSSAKSTENFLIQIKPSQGNNGKETGLLPLQILYPLPILHSTV